MTLVLRRISSNPLLDRFLRLAGPRPTNRELCWLWAACLDRYGYGQIKDNQRKTVGAHRVSYSLFNGDIGNTELVMHSCDTPRCVSPLHLIKGTSKLNTLDRDVKNRGCFPGDPRHPQTKLTAEVVREIKDDIRLGFTQTELAYAYKASKSAIADIIHNRSWTEI